LTAPAARRTLRALSRREADIFAALCDAAVAPEAPMPPVTETSAVRFFDEWVSRAPAGNRLGLRAALHAVEVAPLAIRAGGPRRRLRALPRAARERALEAMSRSRGGQAAGALRAMAQLAYYGDDAVMRGLGYDPDAVTARGAALRAQEHRW
jgi:hypothetical protein